MSFKIVNKNAHYNSCIKLDKLFRISFVLWSNVYNFLSSSVYFFSLSCLLMLQRKKKMQKKEKKDTVVVKYEIVTVKD